MMLCKRLLGIILFCFASFVSPTTINGRFTVLDITSTEFIVLLQVNTNTGTDDLGGATIVFGFDATAISFPGNPIKDVDYIFNNFCSGNYSSATVTRPMNNQIWVNIDLPFINSNNGTMVTGSPEWTDVVTINFNIIDLTGAPGLSWLTTNLFWGIYDADNSTLWQTGEFEDLLDFPFPTDIGSLTMPKYFELAQNYPNPFNPSTKIRYTVPSVIATPLERGKQSQLVTLKVYDILGNEVATLVDEEKEPGIYEVEFSAATLSGSISAKGRYASGVYIYRLHSSEFSDTKKMVLLR